MFLQKASNSDAVIQLGGTGRGNGTRWPREALCCPFTKEGSNYPWALCPKDDLASRLGEVLAAAAASQVGFLGPQTHL